MHFTYLDCTREECDGKNGSRATIRVTVFLRRLYDDNRYIRVNID